MEMVSPVASITNYNFERPQSQTNQFELQRQGSVKLPILKSTEQPVPMEKLTVGKFH